jgi:MFS family permease
MTATAVPLPGSGMVATPSAAVRWYVLIMMCLVYTLSIADRYVMSTVLEPIRIELHLTDGGIGWLTGVSLGLFYVAFGFPLSYLTDRTSRRNIISASLVAWSVMTTFCGLSRNYWQLLLSRLGVGVGEAGGTPGANSIISDYFPAIRRPMALTVFSLGAPIGAWLGADVAGAINDHFHSWRAVFLWLGVPGVIAGALVFLTVKEPRRGQLDLKDERSAPSFMETMRFLWKQRSAVHVMIGSAVTALWGWGLMWWTPAFLQRMYGLSPGEAGAILGPIHLFGGVAATVFTAWLLARPSMGDSRKIVRLLGYWVGAATLVSIVIYWTHSLKLATALFWIFIPSIYFYIGPCFGLLNNLAQPRMRAVFCASTLFVANVGNLIVAPQLVGMLSDWFAPGGEPTAGSLRLALLCLAPTGLWATAHYFWSVRDLLIDEERAIGVAV